MYATVITQVVIYGQLGILPILSPKQILVSAYSQGKTELLF